MKKRIATIVISLLIAVMVVTPCLADDLLLENKNPDWTVIEDNIQATVTYTPVGQHFDYSLVGTVGETDTDYSLIYYGDPWPGNNPGAFLGEGTSDVEGSIEFEGSVTIHEGLPIAPDENYPEGAKLWLVPSEDYDPESNAMTAWNQASYLYEYNLITYEYKDFTDYSEDMGPAPWQPTNASFTLWVGGMTSIDWVEYGILPSVDVVTETYWNGVLHTLRIVIPEGTEVGGGYCLHLCYDGGLSLCSMNAQAMTFSNPVTMYEFVDGEWVEIFSATGF